jgi:hypothetical protein
VVLEGCTENSEDARELAAKASPCGGRAQRAVLGKPRPVIGTRPSSVGSSPDPGRLGSRAAQRVTSPLRYVGGQMLWSIPALGES